MMAHRWMKRMAAVLTLAGAMAVLSGCTRRIGDLSLVSTGTPQFDRMGTATVKQQCKGSDGRLWILFIPLGGAPSINRAVDRCLDAGKGDFAEGVHLYETEWSLIAVSYGNYSCVGDVGNSRAR